MKKQRTLPKPLSTIIWYVRLILNKYSTFFLSNTLWNVSFILRLLLLLLLCILIKEVGVEMSLIFSPVFQLESRNFQHNLFSNIISSLVSLESSSLLLKSAIRRFLKVWFIHPFVSRDNLQCTTKQLNKFCSILTCRFAEKW